MLRREISVYIQAVIAGTLAMLLIMIRQPVQGMDGYSKMFQLQELAKASCVAAVPLFAVEAVLIQLQFLITWAVANGKATLLNAGMCTLKKNKRSVKRLVRVVRMREELIGHRLAQISKALVLLSIVGNNHTGITKKSEICLFLSLKSVF